jgi:urea transport system permease protein
MSPAAGIEMAIWAAVGGRATLVGPIVGAFFVNGAKSWFTVAFSEFWLYFLGALFIAVTLFLPQGIAGLARKLRRSGGEARPLAGAQAEGRSPAAKEETRA